ncbi:MAG: metallophosphoesterase [Clostridia bacterium]|nr:metallophosphoesterase [Clostridia bacterium]
MTYVVSNIHGDYESFKALLETIKFKDTDIMYILGDIVDYGEGGIELINDISMRYNVYPIVGEHDFTALKMLAGFSRMLESGETPTPEFISEMTEWSADGGAVTLSAFRELDEDAREGVIDYLSDMALYEEIEVGGQEYLLVHAGIANFTPDIDLDTLDPEDFFGEALDLTKKYYDDKIIIVGHNPTTSDNGGEDRIFYGNNSIDIDCGVARGGRLGCLCLENKKEYYI